VAAPWPVLPDAGDAHRLTYTRVDTNHTEDPARTPYGAARAVVAAPQCQPAATARWVAIAASTADLLGLAACPTCWPAPLGQWELRPPAPGLTAATRAVLRASAHGEVISSAQQSVWDTGDSRSSHRHRVVAEEATSLVAAELAAWEATDGITRLTPTAAGWEALDWVPSQGEWVPSAQMVCLECRAGMSTGDAGADAPPLCGDCLARVEPAPGAVVWVAAARAGIEAHRYLGAGRSTRCRRSTRTGQTLAATDAKDRLGARWCRKCWAG